MHVWGKKRDILKLNLVEKFHLDMLKTFQDQQKKFDELMQKRRGGGRPQDKK